MSSRAERTGHSTTLLVVRAGDHAWAIPSWAVHGVEGLADDATSDEPDVLELLGMAGSDRWSRRVVVLRAEDEQARVLVRGSIALTDASPEELVPLPAELASVAPLVTHVAVVAGRPAWFVVSPSRLLRAARATERDITPNDTEHVRGSLC